jgi:membrane protease YdiL (CAAX protease family)
MVLPNVADHGSSRVIRWETRVTGYAAQTEATVTTKAVEGQVLWALTVYLAQIPLLLAYVLEVIPIHPIATVMPLVVFLNARVDRRGPEGLGLGTLARPWRSALLVSVFAFLGLGGRLAALRLEGILLHAPPLTLGTARALATDLALDVFIIALWEEIVSRGYVQTRLQEAWGFRGLLVAALLFASLHLPSALHDYGWTVAVLNRFAQVLLGGLLLGCVYWSTKSVPVAIALHGLRNFLALSLMVYVTGLNALQLQASRIGFQLLWLAGEVGLMVLACRMLFHSVPATTPVSGTGLVNGLRGRSRILKQGRADEHRP